MKLTLSILLVFIVLQMHGQNKNYFEAVNESRVFMQEKHNYYLNKIPEHLLMLYARGEIKGYHPYNPNQELGFFSFMDLCNIPYNVSLNSACLECMDRELIQLRKDVAFAFDIVEKKDDPNAVLYLRLVYKNLKGEYLKGAAFRYEDVLGLSEGFNIQNPKNEAMKFSLKDAIRLHYYTTKQVQPDAINPPFEKVVSPYNDRIKHEE